MSEVKSIEHPEHRHDCIFCIDDPTVGTFDASGDIALEPERILREYRHWWLVIQREQKRRKTKLAAGFLVAKRAVAQMTEINAEEIAEVIEVIPDAAARLCEEAGTTYTGQVTGGFNQGPDAGQTVPHVHFHVTPVSAEDPSELAGLGYGKALEALYAQRVLGA